MKRQLIRAFIAALASCFLIAGIGLAQTTSGQISGRVVDPDGRSIVNAEVTLTNQLTAERRAEKTDASGDFVFASVQPGTFILAITGPGFKTFTKRDLVLTASERLSAGTMRMETGAVTQSVEVNADATPVQTESGERSALLDEHQIANLLNPARNVMQLNRILPGVVATNGVGSDQLGIFGIDSVNGIRSEYNSASVDGIMGNTRGRDQIETPLNMDAVSEVKILTNNYQAEYGGTSGTPINMVSKSGTRDFHGSVYYFKRHEEFNANQFFNSKFWNSANGIPIEIAKPQNRFNTIGYNIGGPVWIPKVDFNRKRDKLFFFFSQEIWPTVHPGDGNPLKMTVPTALERQGDFSQSVNNSGKPITLKDPKNCGAAGTAPCLSTGGTQLAFINPNIQKLLNLLPLPNVDPASALAKFKYNYQVNLTEKNPVNQRVLRLDYNISDKWHAYFRGLDMNVKSQGNAAAFIPMQWLTSLPVDYDNHSPNVNVDVTYIASPTLINEFSIGYAGWSEQQVFPNGTGELSAVQKSALGIAVGQFRPQLNPLGLMPTLTFGGGISNSPTFGLSGSGGRFPINSQASSYDITDGLTRVWPGHISKTGIYLHFDRFVQLHNAGNFAGNYDFTSSNTNPLDANNTYANALLGNFRQYTESTAAPDSDPITHIFDWYIQDNWKILKNFTLDYGLRFTWDLPQRLHAGANFVPALYDPSQTPVLYTPAKINGRNVVIDPRNPTVTVAAQLSGAVVPGSGNPFDGLVPITNTNIIRGQGVLVAPRIGFAWDIFGDGKTALRGGFGVFYNSRPPASQAGDLATNPPVQSNPVTPFGNVSQLFSGGSTSVIFPSNLNRTLQGHGNRPVFYNTSLGIQRRIGFQTVVDVAYVGTLGRHLGQSIDLNALQPGIRFRSTSLDPTTGKALADNFLRRYIGLGSVPFVEFEGTSNYNALQVQVTRRFTRGLEFGANYTWSKALDFSDSTTSGVANFAPIHAYNYGLAGFDRDHAVKINWLWDIPKASRVWDKPVMRAAFDNWQLSGIASFIRGQPRGITLSTSPSFDIAGGGDAARVLLLGNPVLGWGDHSRLRYFNTDLIAAPAMNALGSNGQYSSFLGNAGKVVFHGPGTDNWDLALFKNIPIKERMAFQFRCEFYNAFNHPSFNNVDTSAQFTYNPATGLPGKQQNDTLGQVNSEVGPRQIQFSARFSF